MDLHGISSLAITRNAIIFSQMEALYLASQAVAQSKTIAGAMKVVLEILDTQAGMGRGVITLLDAKQGGMLVRAIHNGSALPTKKVFYRPDEGMLGVVARSGQPVVVERPTTEPRFIHRLGLLDPDLPFIGVPIPMNEESVGGVLAAQPRLGNKMLLAEQTMLLEIFANLLSLRIRGCREFGQCRYEDPEPPPLAAVVRMMPPPHKTPEGFDPRNRIITTSSAMAPVFERIAQAARWESPVLVQGESGTGKELVANAIHHSGPGAAHKPFIKVNCAALSDNLLESELFGHEKGAFTGAVNAKPGRFELAHGGTLFLDEIGEIPPAFQTKLLRVLQEGEFERVGGTRTLKVHVRLITATNADLYAKVRAGSFRADLFYRLFVLPIQLPPLRERAGDVAALTDHFLNRLSDKQERPLRLTASALERLKDYDWPGNVRELENCLERAAVMSRDGVIDAPLIQFADHLPLNAPAGFPAHPGAADLEAPDLTEREKVMAALEMSGWVQAKAGRLLGMTPRQIAYRIKVLDIPMRHL